ncbi:MAG: VOC family protein [Acidobacteriota bacterium]|nr:VOC family protein [Acidobacteriota bacterium]
MNRFIFALFLLASALCAQLAAPNDKGVAMGHLHLNVSDIAAQKHFWVDLLGASPVTLGKIEGVKVPGAIVLFNAKVPSAGSDGSVVNHVGLKVKDLKAANNRLAGAGVSFEKNPNGHQIMITGPDLLRVELTEDAAMTSPVAFHHIHFYTEPVLETQAWYVKTFGAKPGRRAIFDAADLPGVNLTFSKSESKLAPTKGRVLDHIGFEVKNLEAFCKELEARGVKFDVPYRKVPSLGIAIAFFTDPWGTYIELTEGLDKR